MDHSKAMKAAEARNSIFGEKNDTSIRRFLICGGIGALRLPQTNLIVGTTAKNTYLFAEYKVEKSDSPIPYTKEEEASLSKTAAALNALPYFVKLYGARASFYDIDSDKEVKSFS